MKIQIAITDTEIAACYPVMRELRPHIAADQFIARVRSQERTGFRLAFAQEMDAVVAVAGFRIVENLGWGRFLYVDDLVAHSTMRSMGYGAKFLSWLKEYALTESCVQLHLDSYMQRTEAHRFYQREGVMIAGYHFAVDLAPGKSL